MIKNDSQRTAVVAKEIWQKPKLQELDMSDTAGNMGMGGDGGMMMMSSS